MGIKSVSSLQFPNLNTCLKHSFFEDLEPADFDLAQKKVNMITVIRDQLLFYPIYPNLTKS